MFVTSCNYYCSKCSKWRPSPWKQARRCHHHSLVALWTTICLLYARPDHIQMLMQLVFQKFQSGLCLSFCCKLFYGYVSSKSSNSYSLSQIKCDSLCTDQFPWLMSSDVDGWNKVNWYPVLSKFINYILIPKGCRLFVDLLYQVIWKCNSGPVFWTTVYVLLAIKQ